MMSRWLWDSLDTLNLRVGEFAFFWDVDLVLGHSERRV